MSAAIPLAQSVRVGVLLTSCRGFESRMGYTIFNALQTTSTNFLFFIYKSYILKREQADICHHIHERRVPSTESVTAAAVYRRIDQRVNVFIDLFHYAERSVFVAVVIQMAHRPRPALPR